MFGLGSNLYWLIGGAVGRIAGSLLFRAVLWLVDPTIVTETIPAMHGVEPGVTGWLFHVGDGISLGIIFGYFVSRDVVLGTLAADVETHLLANLSLSTRLGFAGLVFGVGLWAILPLVHAGMVAIGMGDPGFPVAAAGSLVGHMVYGAILGFLFSFFVEVATEAKETKGPFEEAGGN